MDLHEQIKRMHYKLPDKPYKTPETAYLAGYRDARHAAAELAMKADSCIEALRAIVRSAELNQAAVNTFLLIDARDALAAVG